MSKRDARDDDEPKQGTLNLPVLPDEVRSVPVAALYSALFAPGRRGVKREAITRQVIASVSGFTVRYTGLRLDQGDFDVFAQCIHFAAQQGVNDGRPVVFKTREMLRAIGRSTGGKDRKWLLESLSRLKACEVEVSYEKNGQAYGGSLIAEQMRDDVEGLHRVQLNPKLGVLFRNGWSALSWPTRLQISGEHPQLARWLHGFTAGAQKPLTFKLTNLQTLANSSYARLRDFRAALESAADAIRAAGGNLVLVWSEDGSQVTFSKSAK